MKTLKNISIILLVAFGFCACDSLLDVETKHALPQEEMENEEGARSLIIGVYDRMQEPTYAGRDFLTLPDVMGDNVVKLLVVKNKLLHKAFEASDIDYTPLYECLKGNTAVMFTQTANVPAKLIKEYKKEGIPALKGAYAEESFFVGADKLDELVAIKSKNELIAEVVALLQSPIKNVVSGLNAGGKIHGLLDAIAERNK